jgi:hypothetical protein
MLWKRAQAARYLTAFVLVAMGVAAGSAEAFFDAPYY